MASPSESINRNILQVDYSAVEESNGVVFGFDDRSWSTRLIFPQVCRWHVLPVALVLPP